jgi:cytochrome P450
MAGRHPQVEDWATDFDHTDPRWVADPYPIWAELRDRCPVAHSDRYGGTWLPVRHADIAAVAYDTEHFSSHQVVVSDYRAGPDDVPRPIGGAPPITSDPPFHALARRLLLPPFSPKAIAKLEPFTRATCHELIDAIDARGVKDSGDARGVKDSGDARGGKDSGVARGAVTVDAAADYAQHIPARVIARMLGFPDADADRFREWIKLVLEDVDDDSEERDARFEVFEAYLDERIADHVAEPRDNLTTWLLNAEVDGQRLAHEHVRGTMLLLMVAGIDTTWSAIGAALWHLGAHPSDRQRLRDEPDLLDIAVEELLRAYAPVTMARVVTEPVELGGRALEPGDWLLLPFPAANRDPLTFERADEVVIDRAVNRHAAFGLGIHRCLGSNLARMELRVALEVWLGRHPDFELSDPAAVTWAGGQVRGPRSVPVRLLDPIEAREAQA